MSSLLQEELPPLVELPVYRDTYCSQQMTDDALSLLWKRRSDLVRLQGALEPSNYDQTYLMQLAAIVEFFRTEASKELAIPETRLGMLDLVYELSRRLRMALGIPPWELRGRALANSPDTPLPPLPPLPIKTNKGVDTYFGMTQEIADRIIAATYVEAPELFYERVECLRRGDIWPWDTLNELKSVIRANIQPEELKTVKSEDWLLRGVNGEIAYRLVKLCDIQGVIVER